MRRVFTISTLLGVMLLFIAAISSAPKKVSLWMAGDSTMCLYEDSRAPIAGWGMPFAGFFDSSVSMHNHARGGRSTRTFINEKRWQSILDSIAENDYVFIQFGHNDEAKEEKYKDRYTSLSDYKANLRMFIQTSRLKKAIPVLV
ncbi:MAG: GntR family transcriptional regulator, partial [Chitinophagaceae bacterium]